MADDAIIRIAICGFGEIATKAHLPSIQGASKQFRLVAVIDPHKEAAVQRLTSFSLSQDDVSIFESLSECLKEMDKSLSAVAVCTPSSVTLDLASEALKAGKHVLVEKPPGDWRRLEGLQILAQQNRLTFFTAYHTAACVGLPDAKRWLEMHRLEKVKVTWLESVRKWHPGQHWVTRKGPNPNACEGVLDMVFNPLSLLCALFAGMGSLSLDESQMVVPANWETPISGSFSLTASTTKDSSQQQIPVTGDFAWDYHGDPEEIWTIDFYSSTSNLSLTEGGCQAYIDGKRVTTQPTAAYPLEPEYQNLYQQFATLIANHACAVDDTTPRLLQEIQYKATRSACEEYII